MSKDRTKVPTLSEHSSIEDAIKEKLKHYRQIAQELSED
ncbi:hypothetical protein HRED_05963 [Candidatus Haloredivivus sp. G17]|nr:hypothetical protein HRED_05963 [Candidatus Haloredivivus sp. G17]